jgi:WD40 repeat protein
VIHREGSEATLIEWHPVHTMLASGWADGTVCLWTEKERVLRFAYHRLCLSVCLSVYDWSLLYSLYVTNIHCYDMV